MCGIAGLVAPRLDAQERLALVAGMTASLRHRGPTSVATWSGEGVALGLARLAIVAPEQPASVHASASGAVRAVVNGEFYNHAELRRDLAARGRVAPDGIDTELVTHLYEEHGAQFPMPVDGMFAAAVWDAASRTLLLARDRAGEKPLFMAAGPEWFAFASEPGALVALPFVSRAPCAESLARYLVHGFFAGEDCGFAAIRQLPPASVLVVREGAEHRARYWRPWDALAARAPAPADAIGATRELLQSAVASRLPADVPFGVLLSGGVDSSLVSVLAARVHGRRFPTFSARLVDRGYDESGFARAVAAAIGSEHHELDVDHVLGEEVLERFASRMDQPLGDPSLLPTWAISRLAAEHVPVVLTGEGADEIFAGYPTYLGHRWAPLAGRLPRWARAAITAAAGAIRPRHHHVTVPYLVERFLEAGRLTPFERHLAWFGTARAAEARRLLAPALRAGLGEDAPLGHLDRLAANLSGSAAGDVRRDPRLVAYQLLDFELYLPGDLLTKIDRCSMAHGVESRAPFLRREMIEFALGLPENLKLRGRSGKWVLKQAAKGLLPPELLARRKQGFSPPFSAWSRGPLRAQVAERLSSARIERAGVLDPAAVSALVDDHLAGRSERGRTVWTLLSLQMWAEHWVEGRGEARTAAAGDASLTLRPGAAAQ